MLLPLEKRPRCSALALAAILLIAAITRLWRLEYNGFGNEYYSAGVRSMLDSWHNFFFHSFDPAGFISVDKPPLAFWIQALSAKLFGFSGLSVLIPEALMGVASVALLYHLVARRFGTGTGLLAALFLAITPINVAIDRSNNPDTLLVLLLLLAAWALLAAAERARLDLLLVSMGLIGLAFNVKMLAAFVVVPVFLLVYFVGARPAPKQAFLQFAASLAVLGAVSLVWIAAYDATPASARPFAGTTMNNSMTELAFVRIGFERFGSGASAPGAAGFPVQNDPPRYGPSQNPYYDNQPTGFLRLAERRLAAQAGWLMPLAAVGLLAFFLRRRTWWPPDAQTLSILLFAGWAGAYGLICSFDGGAFHAYYLATLAPPVAALAAIGITLLWNRERDGKRREPWLALALIFTAAWQAYVQYGYLPPITLSALSDWRVVLFTLFAGGALVSVAWLLFAKSERSRALAVSAGIAALLITPTLWAMTNVLARGNIMIPSASLALLEGREDRRGEWWAAGYGVGTDDEKLFSFLQKNYAGERYALATINARLAAPIVIHTGLPVMAIGGFSGSDATITQDELVALVREGKLRYFLLSLAIGEGAPRLDRRSGSFDWVTKNGRQVDASLWRSAPRPIPGRDDIRPYKLQQSRSLILFDLKPQ
jgi:4-amino-4-deoxy-L-arabinose transferase-like glycosyltransferase